MSCLKFAVFILSISWALAQQSYQFKIVSSTDTPTPLQLVPTTNAPNSSPELPPNTVINNVTLQTLLQRISQIEKKLEGMNFTTTQTYYPKHCKEIQDKGNTTSGVYTVRPEFAPEPFLVLCDMDNDGGGWTYFMNRFNGDQEFFLGWNDYKTGFGNLKNEFWLGLDNLHYLTGHEVNELLIQMEDWDTKKMYARYDAFSIGSESEGYIMRILGNYTGDAGENLSYHGGIKFTTVDRDNDLWKDGNCADHRNAGWWYSNCVRSHLTGKYIKGKSIEYSYMAMFWNTHQGPYNLKTASMKVRPRIY